MRPLLTCASNFECWILVAEAIADRGAAAKPHSKLAIKDYSVIVKPSREVCL
jgi:hypothetical protein